MNAENLLMDRVHNADECIDEEFLKHGKGWFFRSRLNHFCSCRYFIFVNLSMVSPTSWIITICSGFGYPVRQASKIEKKSLKISEVFPDSNDIPSSFLTISVLRFWVQTGIGRGGPLEPPSCKSLILMLG